jgi:hypothetical protein
MDGFPGPAGRVGHPDPTQNIGQTPEAFWTEFLRGLVARGLVASSLPSATLTPA